MHAMASQRSLVRLLVLCLIFGSCAAAKRRYHSVSMDQLLKSKAHIDCPPLEKSVTASGNKLTIPAICGLPVPAPTPRCCGEFERDVLNHDMKRLKTLLQRSSVSPSDNNGNGPSAPDETVDFPYFGPAPSPQPGPGIPITHQDAPVAPPAPSVFPFPWILPPVAPPTPWVNPFPWIFPPVEPPIPSVGADPPVPWYFPPVEPPIPPVGADPPVPWYFPPEDPPADAPAVTIPDSSGSEEFVVTVGFGTPVKKYTLAFDTGSDVSWIQCQPCSGHCYKQEDPIFDPTKSATYSALPCGHPQCEAAGGTCSNGTCQYEVTYGDGSSTAGDLSHETLSLTSNRSLPGFAFGCGHTNLGDFGDFDGLIGLGRGALSLPSQAAATLGASFSYCLPSYDTVHGYLTIGSTTPARNDVVQYTKMIHKEEYPSFYFVEMVAIDIGGYVVPVPPSLFKKEGTLIDSGTTLTYIPPKAYTLLRDRFKFVMNWTGYEPVAAYDPFDACFDFGGHSAIFLPAISFNFSDGAVFELSPVAELVYPDDTAPATGCFAFQPTSSDIPFSIIGNTQQKGTEIIYDVAAGKIGFGQGTC